MKYLHAAFLALVTSGPVLAQTAFGDSIQAPNPMGSAPSLFGVLIKLTFSMALIVGLIYASMFLFKKLNSRTAGGEAGDSIRVLGRTYIAPKQCLYVVKIGERCSVLGATESSINLIAELSPEEAEKFGRRGNGDQAAGGIKFGEIFKGKLRP